MTDPTSRQRGRPKKKSLGPDTKTYRLTDRQSQCDFDFDTIFFSYLLVLLTDRFPNSSRTLCKEYICFKCEFIVNTQIICTYITSTQLSTSFNPFTSKC
jgi:hypothetical protein